MKVLFVTHYSFLLGSNRSLESLVVYFQKKGVDVSVLMPSKGLFYEHLAQMGVDVHKFLFFFETLYVKLNKKYLALPLLWLYNFFAFFALCLCVKRINPDVIYSNSSVDGFSLYVAKILRKKYVMHVREFLQEDFGAFYLFGRDRKRKKILKSDKLIFVSNAVAQSVVGYVPPNGRVIYNGLRESQRGDAFKILQDDLRLGIVGNIDISKQQHLLIEFMPTILSKYPRVTLHIVGDKKCAYKQRLLKMVDSMNLKNYVFFEGFVRDTDEIYSKFDVLVMSSRSEAFGRVTVEAMLRNKIVIGYDAGGTSELIQNGVTGYKFKTKNEFMHALDEIINKPSSQINMVASAEKYAKENFLERNYCERVYDFIMEGFDEK